MKFKKVVAFGDSWIWGDELLDPSLQNHPQAHPVLTTNTQYRENHCFVGLLAKHYGVHAENFGIAGGSLQSTIWTYLWWLENSDIDPCDCLILVGLTSPNRQTFTDPNHIFYPNDPPWNKFVHSTWVYSGSTDNEWSEMIKRWTVLSSGTDFDSYNYKQTVAFFQGQSALGIKILQFKTIKNNIVFRPSALLWPETSLQEMLRRQPEFLAPKGHANEQGHHFISSLLISQIESSTM